AGGTWTDLSGSGATITGDEVDLTTLAAGSYQFQYTVTGTAPCADATAVVTVNVNDQPDAGIDDSIAVCNTEAAFNLFDALGGNPDVGGVWTDLDASGGNLIGDVLDVTTIVPDASYRFEYRIAAAATCVDAVAVVTIHVIDSAPEAGADNTVTACNTSTAFDLFAALQGTPDAGGVWNDLDGSGAAIAGNMVNLSTLAAGDYNFEYVVDAGDCGSSSAVVTVSVIVPPDPGLDNNVDACNSDEAFNLFTALGGTPEIGGSWTELTTSGA